MKFGLVNDADMWHHILTTGESLPGMNDIKSLALYCKLVPRNERVILETHIYTQNAMINGLSRIGRIDNAKSLYYRCYPNVGNVYALTSIMHWSFQQGNQDTASEFVNIAASSMSYNQTSSARLDLVYYNTLMSGYAKSQMYEHLWRTIESMPVLPNSSTFQSVIQSLTGSRPSECRPALEMIGKVYKIFKDEAGIRLPRRGYILILVRACHAMQSWEAYKGKVDRGGVDLVYDHAGFLRHVYSDFSRQV
jgi:pentatricopeptide repeat protein